MRKIILVAYDLNPNLGSECSTAYQILTILSKHYSVKVYTNEKHKHDIIKKDYSNTNFVFINCNDSLSRFFLKTALFNYANYIFVRKIKPLIKESIKNDNYDLIHCITPQGVHSYNDLYKIGIPVIVGPVGGGLKIPKGFKKAFRHNTMEYMIRNIFYSYLQFNSNWKKYFMKAKKILISTNYLKELLPRECHKNTIEFFDVIVDPDKIEAKRRKHSQKTIITYVGRMVSQKGPEILIDSIIPILKKYKNVYFNMIGDGFLLPRLKTKAGEHQQINFFGKISREHTIKILQVSDIFCLPTLREPGGVAILEAMAASLPIITTDYGGPANSVTEECGIKIKPKNYDDYVKKLTKALDVLINEREKRIQMGKNGRMRIINEFSPKAVEKKICKIYNEVIRNK
jgi:glycosyltransferase involved in cell wall biosynthesis